MFDRRIVADIGLALLIAFPATLPAAPSPWSADQKTGKPSEAARVSVEHGALVTVTAASADDRDRS